MQPSLETLFPATKRRLARYAANTMKSVPESVRGPASTPASSVPIDTVVMDKHLMGGIAWTAAAKWSSQILTWLCLLIVARLLVPSDFGIVGVAGVYLGLVAVFSEFGFGSAIITLRDLTVDEIAQINTFSAISGTIGFLVSCALATPIGWFFRSPELPGSHRGDEHELPDHGIQDRPQLAAAERVCIQTTVRLSTR